MNQEVQQKYMELQTLTQQLKQLQQQIEMLSQQTQEMIRVKDSVDEMTKAEEGKEILASIGAGIYIKTKLDDNEQVLMSVGSDVVVQKSVQDTAELVGFQIGEMNKIIEKMKLDFEEGAQKVQGLQAEVQKMLAESSITK